MPIRSFRGSQGDEWRVWSVIPGTLGVRERRAGFDRRSPDPVILYRGPERRSTANRRRRAPALPEQMAGGWLIFEGPAERRRLMPIPPHWDVLPERELERLRDRAQPAAKGPQEENGGTETS